MGEALKYAGLREGNSWEGEAWTFYFPDIDDDAGRMQEHLDNHREFAGNFSVRHGWNEERVDRAVEGSGGGYMAFHNKIGRIDMDAIEKHAGEALGDALYKGGIRDFVIPEVLP